MEKTKLEEFNHWWTKGKVDSDLALDFKRDIYMEIEKYTKKRFILALVGLRRVGKTTVLYQLIQKAIQEGVSPENILFFSFDEVSIGLSDVLEKYKEVQKKDFREEKIYFFLDEIQKCNNWQNDLKKYYDLYPKAKFIISGSESLFIRKKTKETMAGRIFEFMLFPFSFREYLRFNMVDEKEFKYENKISKLFIKFAEIGGFPETFRFQSRKDFIRYIKSLVTDKIVYQDIPKIFKIDDPEFLGILLELVATNPGMYIDYFSLSKQFGKDRRVIKDYFSYLRESFLISILGNYRKGSITTLRKKKRAYPSDIALIYIYKSNIDDEFFGRIIETLAVNKLQATSFWKNGHEIDIIWKEIPIEIKFHEKIQQEDFKPLKEFMKKFNKTLGIIITKNMEEIVRLEEGKTIKLIPAWKWFLDEDSFLWNKGNGISAEEFKKELRKEKFWE